MDNIESIKITDTVYDKQKYLNTVNIEFTELVNKTPVPVETIPTVEDFFIIYNQIFYSIPKEGDYSHTTLVSQSSEYLGISNSQNVDIQTLLDEITSLRDELYQKDLLLSQYQPSTNSNEI
jgi:hypothetical protein